MKNKHFINEELSKSDLRKIKSLIKDEISEIHNERKFKNMILNIIKDEYSYLKDLNPDKYDKKIEQSFKEMMQAYHDMFYRDKNIIKHKLSK